MIEDAEKKGLLKPGGTVIEATGGNTAIALAMISAAKGYKAIMAMPASIAQEKIDNVKMYGAEAVLCPGVPFTND
jgi:cysteine synthase A